MLPDPRFADASTQATTCPRCQGSTLNPIAIPGADAGVTGASCARCHGVFVTARSWCLLVARPELAEALEGTIPMSTGPASELLGLLACPVCRQQMERGRFAASSDVVVDVCVRHGMWLDAGELGDVLKHATLRSRAAPVSSIGQVIAEGQVFRAATRTGADRVPASGSEGKGRGRMFLLGGLLLVVLLVTVLGGMAAFGAFGVVKDQVKDVSRAAASASGDLK